MRNRIGNFVWDETPEEIKKREAEMQAEAARAEAQERIRGMTTEEITGGAI